VIRLRCPDCRFVWDEDRGKGDSPIGQYVFLCARCGQLGDRIDKPAFDERQR
jgi:rubredoxin